MQTKEQQLNILYLALYEISPLSKEAWNGAKPFFTSKSLKEKEHLFYMGDDVKDFYFLTSGLARYYYLTDEGKEFNKSFAEVEGHLLSSISSVVRGEPSPFSVEVLSSFEYLQISYRDFLELGERCLEWQKLILRIYENLVIKKEFREADFLLLNARERYEKFLDSYSKIVDVIPNYHIASYLGITEVALSRIRREMGLT